MKITMLVNDSGIHKMALIEVSELSAWQTIWLLSSQWHELFHKCTTMSAKKNGEVLDSDLQLSWRRIKMAA